MSQAFTSWVRRYGATRLSRDLGVSRQAVNLWVNGQSHPRPETANQIISLARGDVGFADIYGRHHRERFQR